MKNILVTGANGQLGRELKDVVGQHNNEEIKYYFVSKEELSITNYDCIESFMRKNKVKLDAIINCAAYTNVEEAETNGMQDCWLVNWLAVKNLAKHCAENNIRLIHISTDYVFNGERNRPYTIFSDRQPLNVYGDSKRKGEDVIMEESYDYLIIRTSWLYSKYGNTFLNKVLKKIEEGKYSEDFELFGTIDEVSSPTNAKDLAEFIITQIIEKDGLYNKSGIYHFSNLGIASRYDFVQAICEYSGNENIKIKPVKLSDVNFKANRPQYSALDLSRTIEDFNYSIPNWRLSLKKTIEEIKK